MVRQRVDPEAAAAYRVSRQWAGELGPVVFRAEVDELQFLHGPLLSKREGDFLDGRGRFPNGEGDLLNGRATF
ncbi:hypothetical protein Acsp01_03840 [Actinoplanes sp. NBRC 101535]|nr:hypothetical protein Acsp01_03840 [Actinoplanes sp. NBRC 101535]